MAEALYRKYRPQVFSDVVGQDHIENTIKNAIEQDKLSHAYLFCGPRGTGKTTTARLLAKALLCQNGPTPNPDGSCEDCQAIAAGEHPDVYELDAASRTGVDNVREEIISRVQFAPTHGRYKVYIIDEVHMLSTAAFNALLKTLEEPPSHVVFILCTTDPQKVPETIHSRCQRFDFKRISIDYIVERLASICEAEAVDYDRAALELVAHRAEGGMRNALTSLEQLIAFGAGKVDMAVAERMLGGESSDAASQIVRFIGARDVAACFRWISEFMETGADLAQFTRVMAERVRNLYVLSLAGSQVQLHVSEETRAQLSEELALFGPDRLARILAVLGDLSVELKASTNPRLAFEIACTRMVRPESDLTLEALAERIEALEAGRAIQPTLASVSPAAVGAVVPTATTTSVVSAATSATASATVTVAAAAATSAPATAATTVPATDAALSSKADFSMASPASVQTEPRATQATKQLAEAPVEASPLPQTASSGFGNAAQSDGRGGSLPDQVIAGLQNPAQLQRMWKNAVSTVRKEKAAYGVLLLNTKAVFDAAQSMLLIEFARDNAFAFKAAQRPEMQACVAAALEKSCGAPLPFAYSQNGVVKVAVGPGVSQDLPANRPAAEECAFAQPLAGNKTASAQPAAALQTATAQSAVASPAASAQPAASPTASAAPASPSALSQQGNVAPVSERESDLASFEDEYVPYDDEYVPYDDEDADCYSEPIRNPAPASYSVEAQADQSAAEPEEYDLAAVLSAGFGDGVTFYEEQ